MSMPTRFPVYGIDKVNLHCSSSGLYSDVGFKFKLKLKSSVPMPNGAQGGAYLSFQ